MSDRMVWFGSTYSMLQLNQQVPVWASAAYRRRLGVMALLQSGCYPLTACLVHMTHCKEIAASTLYMHDASGSCRGEGVGHPGTLGSLMNLSVDGSMSGA